MLVSGLAVISDKSINLAPPWASRPAWQEANFSIETHVRRYQTELEQAALTARKLRHLLVSIFSDLDDLCMATCPWCPEPCCLSASPWFDFCDLLYLHLNQLEIPRTQPIHTYSDTCCYLSSRGCTLSRLIRPWICSWYLCPVQTAYMKKKGRRRWEAFNRMVWEIKKGRKRLEEEFIRVIS